MYAPVLAIRRGHKVGIVEATSILCIGNHGILFFTTSLKVELLEVTSNLVETVAEKSLVQPKKT